MDYSSVELPKFINGSKGLFIGGRWRPARSGEEIDVVNPATGRSIAKIARGGPDDIDDAVTSARAAFEGGWSRWTPHDRHKLLIRIHDLVEKKFDELALIETVDMGAPISRTRSLRSWQSQTILFYASQTAASTTESVANSMAGNFATMKLRAPVGVVGGIIPWNAPLISQWWILGPVLATGCTAVMKPAEDASLTVLRMMELLQEAGVPDGVINVVTGYGREAGAALSEHNDVDRIGFTGSIETARSIIGASAGNIKRLSLELGGKSPNIVFADADLTQAIPGAAMACFTNSGQICAAGTRLFVQRSVHEEFVDGLVKFAGNLRVGNGLDPNVQLGPLVSKTQKDRVSRYVEIGKKEARLAGGGGSGGDNLSSGFFVEPTIFADATNDMQIAREEIFGPVLTVIPFDTIEDAVRLANNTNYGLAGGVWTRDLSTAHRMVQALKAGTLWVNSYSAMDPTLGFGGYKMSGYGWKGSREHVDSFLYSKAVYMNLG